MIPKHFLPGVILTLVELKMTKHLENHCTHNSYFYIHFLSVLWRITCYVVLAIWDGSPPMKQKLTNNLKMFRSLPLNHVCYWDLFVLHVYVASNGVIYKYRTHRVDFIITPFTYYVVCLP